jgi:ParB-like chromosome segregation protein Spo0J
METERILVEDIHVGTRKRQAKPEAVAALADSMRRVGQLTPIEVRIVDQMEVDGEPVTCVPVLVAGLHRLEALKSIGEEYAECRLITDDAMLARMIEISENLHRADLTMLERSEQEAEWIELRDQWDARGEEVQSAQVAQIESKRADGKGHRPEGGLSAAARELGLDRDAARRSIKVASLSDEAKEAARECGLDDNRTALLDAAKAQTPEQQVQRLHQISAAKKSAKAADSKSLKEEAEEKLAGLLAEHIPGEHWDALKANLHAAGAHRIAAEFVRLTGVSVFDRTRAGAHD